jgi:hypothetical protein
VARQDAQKSNSHIDVGLLFQSYHAPRCCLCGEIGSLTGEHKIKAAILKQEFGKDRLSVHETNSSDKQGKIAQSVKSKYLKFESRMCQACNSDRTQMPDREFDAFTTLALQKLRLHQEPKSIFDENKYQIGSPAYLNLFRYFAKLLCCHLAEVDAPIPKRLSKFAICRSQRNCVWLDIRRDRTYEQAELQLGEFQYAAHGGLVVYGNKDTNAPEGFHSTLSFGILQYVFFIYLTPSEILELKYTCRKFYDWCCSEVELAKQTPISASHQHSLGLLE